MIFAPFHFTRYALLPALLLGGKVSLAAPPSRPAQWHDPCAKIAGKDFVDPAGAMACQKSFPFNETLRQNVLSVVSRVFDFYTFEDFYLQSPPPFQESTTDIRAEIQRMNSTRYATDYDFNLDLWDFTTKLNDGHTRWYPDCYITYQNILPAPVVILDKGVFIAPDSVELLSQLGKKFTGFMAAKRFDWKRLAGAKVISIGGLPALQYIDKIASTVSGNFLDHNVRVNSVVSSYLISDTTLTQRVGDLAGPLVLTQTSLEFLLIPANSYSDTPELIDVPFVASFVGNDFSDARSYWANNCAATNTTNGVDFKSVPSDGSQTRPRLARAALLDPANHPRTAVGLPGPFRPTLKPTRGSTGVIKSFVLPGNKTGVMFIGSFLGDPYQFQFDIEAVVKEFKAHGIENLLIDVTNNEGGYVCLGVFLHLYLVGENSGFSWFQSTSRANPLAQKILKADIAQHLNNSLVFYTGDNWRFVNGKEIPENYNYNDPSVPYNINNHNQPSSQRFEDLCPAPNVTIPSKPPFDLDNIAIIGNGKCASTCALFTTIMFEHHNTKMATFGGHLDQPMEFKGMAGSQVFEWSDLDSEIKTAGLKDDPLAPPDLLVSGNMRHNWRTAYSFRNENVPIAYLSETSQYRFPYTKETYNNPQNLWIFAEENIFRQRISVCTSSVK